MLDKLLIYFYQQQEYAGQYVNGQFAGELATWFKNHNEYSFYLTELRDQGLINIFTKDLLIQITHSGNEKAEELIRQTEEHLEIKDVEHYDVGLSFAGEQREFVREVADIIKLMGLQVFYDEYESGNLWGKDLYQYLNDLYKNRCSYCIVFVSKEYAKKMWTKHELRSAQARAIQENREFILPIKFDDTELPGLDGTIGYLSVNKFTPREIAEMVLQKIQISNSNSPPANPLSFKEYTIIIRGTFSYNIDLGIPGDQATSDIWWNQQTKVERYLTPWNGCEVCVLGQIAEFENIDRTFVQKLTYSSSAVIGHDDSRNQIPDNTIIAFLTKSGQYGLLRVNEYGYNLNVTYKLLE